MQKKYDILPCQPLSHGDSRFLNTVTWTLPLSKYKQVFIKIWNRYEKGNLQYTTMQRRYSESSQISKMEIFVKIINSWKRVTIFAKSYILGAWQGSEYAFLIDELSMTKNEIFVKQLFLSMPKFNVNISNLTLYEKSELTCVRHLKSMWQTQKSRFNDNRRHHYINKFCCAIWIWKKNISHSF